jgi:hypothetical protein
MFFNNDCKRQRKIEKVSQQNYKSTARQDKGINAIRGTRGGARRKVRGRGRGGEEERGRERRVRG